MVRFFVAVILLMALGSPAAAGPWLREKGASFTSASFTINKDLESATSTYIEYGLFEKMTIGADIGMYRNLSTGQTGFATFFMRRNFGKPDGRSKWAYELGAGAGWIGEELLPHLKTGVSWGRGFQLREKGGWMVVDASVRWDLAESLHLTKIDGTVGLNFNNRFTGMLQIYLSHVDSNTTATLAPSVIWAPKARKFKLQVGLESLVMGGSDTALKFGLWREF